MQANYDGNLSRREISDINADLSEVVSVPYSWPLAGYEAICEALSQAGISVPVEISGENNSEEIIFPLKELFDSDEDLFVYICYEENKKGSFEFFAEIVNESDLNELLNEDDERTTEEDDSDNYED